MVQFGANLVQLYLVQKLVQWCKLVYIDQLHQLH